MAERDSRNKKFFTSNKDKKDGLLTGSRRQPIILAKPDRDRDNDREKERMTDTIASAKTTESQPTIILQQRRSENRTVSPVHRSSSVAGVQKKENDVQPPVYQLAAKHSGSENVNPLAPPPEMKSCVKLMDETLQFSDSPLEYLLDQTDFTVVGCIGLQGVGKSTIMSLISGVKTNNSIKPNYVFKPATVEQQETASHSTIGIDLYVTSNRTIVLDMQALLSASVMDRLINMENKKFSNTDFSSDNTIEVQSLQLTAFMLSVCHVVLVIQDTFVDPNFVRFLLCAEMLKPPTPIAQDQDAIEYFPHVMFVHNRATMSDFSELRVRLMQDMYSKMFAKSRLQIHSGMGIATGNIISYLSPKTCGELVNLYFIPDIDEPLDKGHFKGHPGLNELLQKLQEQLLGVERDKLIQAVLSEKNWFHFSVKVWEAVKKSSLFSEYSRLLP